MTTSGITLCWTCGFTIASGETISVDGVSAEMDDVLESGDTVIIVGKKDGGVR